MPADKLVFVELFWIFRAADAAGKATSIRCRVQPPAGDFLLGEKVTKAPHKGISPYVSPWKNGVQIVSYRHFLVEMAKHLPRSPALAALFGSCAFVLECLIKK